MNWKIFFRTLGYFYSIAFGFIFVMSVIMIWNGHIPDNTLHFSELDFIFALWAIGTALIKASNDC